jgi:hypothetical protein
VPKVKKAEVTLEYQPVIPGPPVHPKALNQQACSNDSTTIDSWGEIWVSQIKANRELVGDFASRGVGQLFGKFQHKAAIIAGSGPSLKLNGAELKDRKGVPLISCLHNFHFFEDRGITPDFYVSLDAGPVVLEEIAEGGALTQDEYWERTKNHRLVAYVGSHPDLLKKWKGEVYFFNCCLPEGPVRKAADEAAGFYSYLGSGGNVLGACLYLAKAVLGCPVVAFVGADMSFSYDKKFHGWDSKYDADVGHCLRVTDIFGHKRLTWQSYHNFKCWFEYVACSVPGFYVNCTEGGILGAHDQGNIAQFQYMDLCDFLELMSINEHVRQQYENPRQLQELMLF